MDSIGVHVAELASGAGEAIQEGYDKAAEQARQGYDVAIKTVAQNPLASVGIALSVGVFFGLMMGISIGADRARELSWRDRWNR